MARKILIVDDSIAMRQSTKFTLESGGFAVFEAGDGIQALKVFAENTADLIITDINMPNMDGITLIRELRGTEKARYTPILVLTTESQGPVIEQGKKAGATGWIVKPYTPERLLEIVGKVVPKTAF